MKIGIWVKLRGKGTKSKTRPDTRHKMRLVCVLFTFENNTGPSYGRTDGHDLLYRDATAHLKRRRGRRKRLTRKRRRTERRRRKKKEE